MRTLLCLCSHIDYLSKKLHFLIIILKNIDKYKQVQEGLYHLSLLFFFTLKSLFTFLLSIYLWWYSVQYMLTLTFTTSYYS